MFESLVRRLWTSWSKQQALWAALTAVCHGPACRACKWSKQQALWATSTAVRTSWSKQQAFWATSTAVRTSWSKQQALLVNCCSSWTSIWAMSTAVWTSWSKQQALWATSTAVRHGPACHACKQKLEERKKEVYQYNKKRVAPMFESLMRRSWTSWSKQQALWAVSSAVCHGPAPRAY